MDWKKKLDINQHDDNLPKKTSAKKYEVIQEELNEKINYSIFNKEIIQQTEEEHNKDINSNSEDIKNIQMCFFTFFAFIGITSFFFSGSSLPANTTYLLGIDMATIYSLLKTTNFLLMLAMIPPLFNNIRGSNKFTRSMFKFLPNYGKYKIGKLLTTFMITFTASTGISFLNSWGAFDAKPVATATIQKNETEMINYYKDIIDKENAKIQEMKDIAELRDKSEYNKRIETLRELEALKIKMEASKIQEAIAIQELKTQTKIKELEKYTKNKNNEQADKKAANFIKQNQEMEEQTIKYINTIMKEHQK